MQTENLQQQQQQQQQPISNKPLVSLDQMDMKEKVMEILQSNNLEDKRARTMDIDDFLK